jgi:heat shock protein HtpX
MAAASAYTVRDRNIWGTYLLMTTFLIVVIGIGWALSWYFGDVLLLYIAVVIALVMNIGSYWFSDKIILSISGAKPATREQYFDLWNATENLAKTAGLPMPRVYVIDDPAPNAFATGRNAKNGVVAVTTGLLRTLDKSELEGVIAHELAHIKHADILLQSIVVTLVAVVTLVSDFFLRTFLFGGDRGGGQLRVVGIIIGLALAILAPLIATLLKFAISRKREFMADAGAVLITRYPEGLAGALRKISNHNAPMQRANHATAHLFISNPFGPVKKARSFMDRIFSTHPPIEDRIKALVG